MKITTFAPLALIAGLAATPAFALTDDAPLGADIVAARLQAAPRAVSHAARASGVAQPKVAGSQTLPNTPFANGFRAYPPSCAADRLPDKPTSTTYAVNMPFWARNLADLNHAYLENVTVTVWRIPCSSSGAEAPYNHDGAPNAITLLRIDRSTDNEGQESIYPTFPILQVKQGSIDFTITSGTVTMRNPKSYPRVASEPNTVRESANYDNAIIDSTTFVLENFPDQGSGYFNFNDAFTLRVDPNVPGVIQPVDIAVPEYAPTETTYPLAFEPRPLDGYAAAQWVNTELNQGLLVQVTEQVQGASIVRQLVFDLLSEDLAGDPLWLVGNAAFNVGQTSLTVDVNYLGNGLAQLPYGSATFELHDCNRLDVTFTPNANLPAPIPAFEGLTTYDRLFTPNGMPCE